jgi:hypothetical protein
MNIQMNELHGISICDSSTICSNGWNNKFTQRPLLNVMFAYPSGNAFIIFIDTIGEQKDAHYICNELVEYIETIEVDTTIQICTYNASNMKV